MTDLQWYLIHADQLSQRGEWAEVLTLLDEAMAQWPLEPRFYLRAAAVTFVEGDRPKSLELVTQAAELARKDPETRVRCALLLYEIGALAEVARILDEIRGELDATFPLLAEVTVLGGHLLRHQGQLQQAEAAYRAGLDDLPREAGVGLARLYESTGRQSEAVQVIEHALTCAQNFDDRRVLRGELLRLKRAATSASADTPGPRHDSTRANIRATWRISGSSAGRSD